MRLTSHYVNHYNIAYLLTELLCLILCSVHLDCVCVKPVLRVHDRETVVHTATLSVSRPMQTLPTGTTSTCWRELFLAFVPTSTGSSVTSCIFTTKC